MRFIFLIVICITALTFLVAPTSSQKVQSPNGVECEESAQSFSKTLQGALESGLLFRLSDVLAILSLLIAFSSAIFSGLRWRSDRVDRFIEKRPRLTIYFQKTPQGVGLALINSGLGPAIVKEFRLRAKTSEANTKTLDPDVDANQVWYEALHEFVDTDLEAVLLSRAWRPEDMIPTGESSFLIEVDRSSIRYQKSSSGSHLDRIELSAEGRKQLDKDAAKLRGILSNCRVEIEYESIYSDDTMRRQTALWPREIAA